MSNDVQELQIKIAFLEQALQEMSDEFYSQQKELELLKERFDLMLQKVSALDSQEGVNQLTVDEKPPHY